MGEGSAQGCAAGKAQKGVDSPQRYLYHALQHRRRHHQGYRRGALIRSLIFTWLLSLAAVGAYGFGLFLFISAVWYKWYPALQAKLHPTLLKWVFKVGLNGLAGFVGYLYAHHYLNTITGVESEQFPQDPTGAHSPLRAYIWLTFIALGAGLVVTGFMLWFLGVIIWNGVVRIGEIPYFVVVSLVVPLGTFVCCVIREFFTTIPNYAACREQLARSIGQDQVDRQDQVG